MDVVWDGFRQAFAIILSGDREVGQITLLSLQVSATATLLSLVAGIPLGALLAFGQFRGRRLALGAVHTGMGLPPVVAGLIVTILLWRSGPLGALHILYTPAAIVIAQWTIAVPIVTGLSAAALQQLDPKLRLQLLALGASRLQLLWLLAKEARLPLLAAAMAGFGGVISEVGASMMVGGNIAGQTRVLTTATVLETSRGNFDRAIALSVLLLVLVYTVNVILTWIQQRGRAA
ncbi:MAG: tungstate transporter permease [Dehalococcoidia bacterium]|nr:tungstate transporter permease [Dehalococcoidia bacterium]